ncbi:Acetyltransferase (GNAT) family protein [Lentzea waywayandensis]|uniref:Acetyltransferase (GNAT) family protein n=1 Tax=Lentzea waywayandensis TaxID=84724 RepID=A0A1I6DGS8_9PSEU|nr:GNAT family N-acetyltransferase [Lentzea waywayandensis]SFR04591.1 Acetyltransferase (GNAT) family protein [Lentzea waywayandensis]
MNLTDLLVHEMVVDWGSNRRVITTRNGETVFECVVRPAPGLTYVTECLPQRDDPAIVEHLAEVLVHLQGLGMNDIVAVHPEFWDVGGTDCGRIVPMWLKLDSEMIASFERALPVGYRIAPFTNDLPGDDHDRGVFEEIVSGQYGPLIDDASLRIVADGTKGAIAVTEDRGVPLIGHLVVESGQRGAGLGKTLLVRSMLALASAGYADCRLNVMAENFTARRLYRSIGFVQDRATLKASRVTS